MEQTPGATGESTVNTSRYGPRSIWTTAVAASVLGILLVLFVFNWLSDSYKKMVDREGRPENLSRPSMPATGQQVVYVEVPVENDDPPPMGWSSSTWQHLPESMKSALRPSRSDLTSPYGVPTIERLVPGIPSVADFDLGIGGLRTTRQRPRRSGIGIRPQYSSR
jgi:hypothetical protein